MLPRLLTLVLFASAIGTRAQQITSVTVAPNPLHGCELMNLHVVGSIPTGATIDFVTNGVNGSNITVVIQMTGSGSGSSPFNQTVGPFGGYAQGTYTLSVSMQYNGTITNTWTAPLTVLAPVIPNVGQPTTISVCNTGAAFSLLSRLTGSPDPGGQWLDPLQNIDPSGMFTPGISYAGEYVYYFALVTPCEPVSQILTINYLPNSTAGSSGAALICSQAGAPPENLFSHLGGTPDPGGTWTGPGSITGNSFIPGVDPAGVYVYHVDGIAPCAGTAASVTVTSAPPADAGIGGSAFYCYNETQAILSDDVQGGEHYGLWYAPDGALLTTFGEYIDVSASGAGTYYYVVPAPPCPADTAFVDVMLIGPPCTVGVGELARTVLEMTLSPNPAHGHVTLNLPSGSGNGERIIEVTDMNGREVLDGPVVKASVSGDLVLDISPLSPGAYLVRSIDQQGVSVRRLMVD